MLTHSVGNSSTETVKSLGQYDLSSGRVEVTAAAGKLLAKGLPDMIKQLVPSNKLSCE
jgi:hypothetical protein